MKKSVVFLLVIVALISGAAFGYVNYEYYEGTWDNVPDFDSLEPVKTGVVSNFDISIRDREENFGCRFRGLIDIGVSGSYTFFTTSDDGSNLYIDDILVVNNDGTHGTEQSSGNVELSEGEHVIEVNYFNKSGGLSLFVHYQGPGIAKRRIGDDVLSLFEELITSKSCCPLPADGTEAFNAGGVLRWEAPGLVDSPEYIIYLGIDPNLPDETLVGESNSSVYDPFGEGDMAVGTKYYWRVDVYDPNVGGNPSINTGDRWSFTTGYGLVAFYDFEVDPNDITGNGHGGTYVGIVDPNIVFDSQKGNVLHLNPDGQSQEQYVEIGSIGISGASARTIAGWAKASSLNISDWTSVFGFAPASGGGGNYFDIECNGTKNYLLHVHGWETTLLPMDTLWHHFAASYDGITIAWYLDGILLGTEERALNTTDEFRIGSRKSHNSYFPGLVDNIGVWDYALSAAEIRDMVLLSDSDNDEDVDVGDLGAFTDSWLDSSVVPDSIMATVVLDDFEKYGVFPPLNLGWFVYLHDSGKYSNANYPGVIATGEEAPYGGVKSMKIHYEFPPYDGDDWLTLGHRLSPYPDLAKYDEIRFRVKYHSDNTDDVGLFIHGANDPPNVIEHEAFNIGPLPTTDDPADPNQWHEIVIDLRNDGSISWEGDYAGVDDVHHFNGLLISIVNSSSDARIGTLYFDDFHLIDYTPDCDGLPDMDLTGDCVVNMEDYAILANEWMREI